jgi:quinol monooxygenase YgiN
MSVTVLLEIKVPVGKSGAVETMLGEMLGSKRTSDGCLSVDAVRNQDDPGNFFLIERWQSRAHHERYMARRAESGATNAVAAELSATFSVRWFDEVAV